jgi:hypothetical protein
MDRYDWSQLNLLQIGRYFESVVGVLKEGVPTADERDDCVSNIKE